MELKFLRKIKPEDDTLYLFSRESKLLSRFTLHFAANRIEKVIYYQLDNSTVIMGL